MATYLPGITDYIPHIQPFKPDYNFYQKALETKEAQYKAGYDKISNLYGTLLNSELTREPNKEKRDRFFQQVQNDIQRLSSVDLSRSENVNTAYTVFQPLIDDKTITHDMAWTKTFRNEKSKGEYLRNCIDPKKCGGDKWWEEGDEYLDHLRNDYAASDDQGATQIGMPRYVPFVNPNERAQEIIKDLAPNVESATPDKSGQWIFKTKNGLPISGKLYEHLTAVLGQDARINDVYDVKAANVRYRYAETNAARFGGDKNAAEQEYVDKMTNSLFQEGTKAAESVAKTKNGLNAKKNAINGYIANNGLALPAEKDKLEQLNHTNGELSLLNIFEAKNKTATEAVSGDMSKLDARARAKRVDYAVAHGLLKTDMMKEAINWASLHSTTDMTANPYGVMAQHQTNAIALANLNAENAQKLEYLKQSFKTGSIGMTNDPAYDHAIPVENDNSVHNKMVGTATGIKELGEETLNISNGNVAKSTANYQKAVYGTLSVIESDPNRTADERSYAKAMKNNLLFGLLDKEGKLKEDFEKDPSYYQSSSPYFFRKGLAKALKSVEGDPKLLFSDEIRAQLATKYTAITNDDYRLNKVDKDIAFNNKAVVNYIKDYKGKDVPYTDMADYLIRPDGHARSKDEFMGEIMKKGTSGVDKNGQQVPLMSAGEAEDVWDSLSTEFAKTMNSNIVKGLKSVNPYGYKTIDGGGIGAQPVEWKVSGDMPTKSTYQYTMSIKPDLAHAASVQFGSDHSAEDIATDNPAAHKFADFLFNELGELRYNERYKGGKIAIPNLKVTFNGISADNKDMVSYKVAASPKYLENLADFKSVKGMLKPSGASPVVDLWDFDKQTWKTNEVTIYTPKDIAQSSAAMAIKKPEPIWDIKLDEGPVSLSTPKGGFLKVEKNGSTYKGNGYLYYFENGKYMQMPPSNDIQAILAGTDADVMMNALDAKLNRANLLNIRAEAMYNAANRISNEELKKQYPQIFQENAGQ